MMFLVAGALLAQNPPAGQNNNAQNNAQNSAQNRPAVVQSKPPRGQANVTFITRFSSDASRTFSNGTITSDKPDNSFGFLAGYSVYLSKWASLEGSYGFSRKTHNYTSSVASISGASSAVVEANAQQITGAFVFKLPPHRFTAKPYGLMGVGALILSPTAASKASVAGLQSQTKQVFMYGGGVEFPVTSTVGIRAEYRGLLTGDPDFTVPGLVLRSITHVAGPSVGMYFKF